MKALILAIAMAVGFASYASAAEVKKDSKAPIVAGKKAMTDADMDKVTAAGVPAVELRGQGLITADAAGQIGIIGRVNTQGATHGIGTGNKP